MAKKNDSVTTVDQASATGEKVVQGEPLDGTLVPVGADRRMIVRDDLDAITSYDEALAILEAHGITPVDAALILADEWRPVVKDDLVNVPFIVVDVKTSWGDFGPFVTCRAVAPTLGNSAQAIKIRFSDGSSGIYEQLRRLKDKYGIDGVGLRCERGLVKSTYTLRNDEGEPILNEKGMEQKGTTYYFSTERAAITSG
jgi:hypothetical protein